MKLATIASKIGAELLGDGALEIAGLATLAEANATQVSFFHNAKYLSSLKITNAAAVILTAADVPSCSVAKLVVDDPYYAYARLAEAFVYQSEALAGIHPRATIHETARVAASAQIGANAVIGAHVVLGERVKIGPGAVLEDYVTVDEDTEIKAQATIGHHVRLGKRVIVHQGAVVGSDGFGNAMHAGRWYKVPQLGSVHVGDDVEIGANTTIDRGALGDTVIESGVRLDNLIQIGHNVKIGAHTAIAACSGIAGSTTIGKYCLFGGNVGVTGHITIADGTILTANARVSNHITEKGIYSSGDPAIPNQVWRKNAVRMRNLDKIIRQLQSAIKKQEVNHG